MSEKRVI